MKIFTERLCDVMAIRGITGAELARRCGITRSAIDTYRSGKGTPRLEVFAKIAKELGVSADYLVGLSDDGLKESPKTFEEKLRYLRHTNKLTHEEVASYVGIDVGRYRRIEYCYTSATPKEIVAFAQYYNVSVDYLLSGEWEMGRE